MSNPFGFQTLEEMAAAIKTILRGDRCVVYNSSPITHTNSGGVQTLLFNGEYEDIGDMYSVVLSASRITFKEPGFYVVFANIEFVSNAVGNRGVNIRRNGGAYIAGDTRPTCSGLITQCIAVTGRSFLIGDYIEAQAYQSSGGSLVINAVGDYSPVFGAVRVL